METGLEKGKCECWETIKKVILETQERDDGGLDKGSGSGERER